MCSFIFSCQFNLQITVLSLNFMPDTSHQDLIRCSCVTLWPVPRPIRRLVASWKESQEMARMSMFLPCCWRKAEVILLPLLTMETDSIPIWKEVSVFQSINHIISYHSFQLLKKAKEKEKRKKKPPHLLTKIHHSSQNFRIQKRFSSSKIDLPHSRIFQQSNPLQSILQRYHV